MTFSVKGDKIFVNGTAATAAIWIEAASAKGVNLNWLAKFNAVEDYSGTARQIVDSGEIDAEIEKIFPGAANISFEELAEKAKNYAPWIGQKVVVKKSTKSVDGDFKKFKKESRILERKWISKEISDDEFVAQKKELKAKFGY